MLNYPNLLSRVTAPLILVAAIAGGLAERPLQAGEALKAGMPILLDGTHGRFDFLEIDASRRRLLAAHTQNGSLDVIDLDGQKLVKSIPTGAAQDSAVVEGSPTYVVSVSKPPGLRVLDAESLETKGTIPLPGPSDLVVVQSATFRAYVAHDDASELWAVSVKEQKVSGTVKLRSDSPEGMCFSADGKRLFQAMKTSAAVEVIDTEKNEVTAEWPTAPAKAPHGMVEIPGAGALLIAGGNGQLVLMSETGGKVLASITIPEKVDQIGYDPGLKRAYCASGQGKIGVVSVEGNALKSLGEVTSAPGAHSLAVDTKTHRVWIAYGSEKGSFVQAFEAKE